MTNIRLHQVIIIDTVKSNDALNPVFISLHIQCFFPPLFCVFYCTFIYNFTALHYKQTHFTFFPKL